MKCWKEEPRDTQYIHVAVAHLSREDSGVSQVEAVCRRAVESLRGKCKRGNAQTWNRGVKSDGEEAREALYRERTRSSDPVMGF
ncbi:hypothetical protein M3J09_007176 [Ascochyta lentis]